MYLFSYLPKPKDQENTQPQAQAPPKSILEKVFTTVLPTGKNTTNQNMSDHQNTTTATTVVDEDWEEWDGVSPFWHHCLAGSTAGLAEHTLVYPLDTVRTHIQVCANCKFSPSYQIQQQVQGIAAAASRQHRHHLHQSQQHRGRHAAAKAALKSMRFPGTAAAAAASGSSPSSPQLPQGVWQTMRFLMSEPAVMTAEQVSAASTMTAAEAAAAVAPKAEGVLRLWRGVQTMLIGCIPAHALYFSSYEMVKAYFSTASTNGHHQELAWYGGVAAGATATLGHDLIMGPLDTVKQRLQIGHYQGSMTYALQQMVQKEGTVALYRSFPITLFANLPYGMIMVSTNESLKQFWTQPLVEGGPQQPLTLSTTLMASSMAGLVASAATTPLDRIKTLLQTQQMAPACWPTPPANCAAVVEQPQQPPKIVIQNAYQALQHVLKQEGTIGLFRGIVPRVMSHTPAVAISWTTYESAKSLLWKITNDHH